MAERIMVPFEADKADEYKLEIRTFLQNFFKEHGHSPSAKETRALHPHYDNFIRKIYGKYNLALVDANLPIRRRSKARDKSEADGGCRSEIVSVIREIFEKNGGAALSRRATMAEMAKREAEKQARLAKVDFDSLSEDEQKKLLQEYTIQFYSVSSWTREFEGSYNAAVIAAGYEPRLVRCDYTEIPEEVVVGWLADFGADLCDAVPTISMIKQAHRNGYMATYTDKDGVEAEVCFPSTGYWYKHFGGIMPALAAAGYDEKKILSMLKAICDKRAPELPKARDVQFVHMIIYHFGTFRAALRALGYKVPEPNWCRK